MATLSSQQIHIPKTNNEKEDREKDYEATYQKYNEALQTLPKERGWMSEHLVQYQGYWFSPKSALKGAFLVQHHFKAQPTDIFLSAYMKCGTTWLRTLMFATMNRSSYDFSSQSHPLLNTGPHACFPFLDASIYQNYPINTDLDALPSPRLFATHIPYTFLPQSVTTSSSCKIVYIWRDPKDVFISLWHFMERIKQKGVPPLPLKEAFDMFCEGVSHYGPFWDHVLEYWKASLESPEKFMFLRYEDLKKEPSIYLKKLAEFMGQPFSLEEEREGVVQEILKLCSFENLSNLEVNKTGVLRLSDELVVHNSEFFRKGKVGDWQNYFTDEMKEKIDLITEQKFNGSGLNFGVNPQNSNC
ncbi:flavonol sulfotransferase-like [Cornus florida]|uniref:flavonol sulfotransferase-like n=1 Tax=Cornus florida TaxID=4283 RepID=UPI00289A8F6E|nr:flavonol sulfotransferase-like [Cornus florida]